MKYIIEKNQKINLEIEVSCRRCEESMSNTVALTQEHLYFTCPKCNIVIVIDLKIKKGN